MFSLVWDMVVLKYNFNIKKLEECSLTALVAVMTIIREANLLTLKKAVARYS